MAALNLISDKEVWCHDSGTITQLSTKKQLEPWLKRDCIGPEVSQGPFMIENANCFQEARRILIFKISFIVKSETKFSCEHANVISCCRRVPWVSVAHRRRSWLPVGASPGTHHGGVILCRNTKVAICLSPEGQNTESCDLGNACWSASRLSTALWGAALVGRGFGKQHGSQHGAFCKNCESTGRGEVRRHRSHMSVSTAGDASVQCWNTSFSCRLSLFTKATVSPYLIIKQVMAGWLHVRSGHQF